MFTVRTIEINRRYEAAIESEEICSELIVIGFELIDGGGLPRVGFGNVSLINGGQADSSLMFCCLHEEGVDGGCLL